MESTEVRFHIDSETSSSEDVDRMEEKYCEKNEAYLQKIRQECDCAFNMHDVAAKNNRSKHVFYSTPVIILPILCGALGPLIPSEYSYLSSVFLSLTGIGNGLLQFRNYSKKFQQHSEFAAKYSELGMDIQSELIRSKKHRLPFDVFLLKITTKYNHLNRTAPMI